MKFRISVSRIRNENLSADEIRATRKGQPGPRLSCGNFFIEAKSVREACVEALRLAQLEYDGVDFKVEESAPCK